MAKHPRGTNTNLPQSGPSNPYKHSSYVSTRVANSPGVSREILASGTFPKVPQIPDCCWSSLLMCVATETGRRSVEGSCSPV